MNNYKTNDPFHSIDKADEDMKKILQGLKDNFSSGNYIPVSLFSRGIRDKKKLTDLIKQINIKQPDYKTGKQKVANDHSGIYLFAKKKMTNFLMNT